MTKQKKKNWFEKIAEIDAKQQYAIEKNSKSPNKKGSNSSILPKSAMYIFCGLAIAMPSLGWVLGALMNPSGWLSKDPSVLLFVPLYVWFISIPLVIVIIALIAFKKTDAATIVTFVASLIYSIFILNATSSASESEFTG
ncbi:MAG TPA: hypothetical protein VIM37_01135 [Candidatus Microsaccharimonas sp.]